MIRQFTAIYGQSMFDVCLNCYGTLDLLYKLLQDSGVDNVNVTPASGQVFTYDDTLIIDQTVFQQTTLSGVIYATNTGNNGSVYYITQQPSPGNPNPSGSTPYIPPQTSNVYQGTYSTHFQAGAPNTTVIVLTDEGGQPLTGVGILQIEKETKPLIPAQYVWNPATSTITLQGTTKMQTGETLFVLYQKIITT